MEDYSTLASLALKQIKSSPGLLKEFQSLALKNKKGTIRYKDALSFSEKLGTEASKIIARLIEDGSTLELEAFAEQFIAPVYTSLQNTTIAVSKNVQQTLNEQNGLALNVADVKSDKSRIRHIVARYREAESFDTVSFLLGEDVIQNITRSAVDDNLKGNADLQSNAGFDVTITRSDGSGCCDWCASKVGTYKRGEEPKDFWAVHKNCSCSFEYSSKMRGLYNKITFSTDSTGKMAKNTI